MNLVFEKFDQCMTYVGIIQAVCNMFGAQSQTDECQSITQPCMHDIEERCLSALQALFQDTKLLM